MPIIDMHEIAIMNDWIYGINYKYNVLCKINISTNEVEKYQSLIIDGEKLQYDFSTEFYRHILVTESLILFMNTCTKHLLIFNLDLQLTQKITLFDKAERVSIIGIRQDKLFIYAIDSGLILKTNLQNSRIRKYQIPKKYIGKINSMGIKIINDGLWITGYMGNLILEITIESGDVNEHHVEGIEGDICLCEKYESDLWICTQYEVAQWDKQKNAIVQVFQLSTEERKDSLMPFYYSCVIYDSLWLFPLKEKAIMRINQRKKEIKYYAVQKSVGQAKRQKPFSFLDRCKGDSVIYGLDDNMNNVILKTDNGSMIENMDFIIEDDLLEEMKKLFFRHNSYLDEKLFSISELLEDTYKNELSKKHDSVGYKIYSC